ncbi:MAG: radical SAM protein [Deltaproteobacteria bacterium]|nr:radical SAM protein [Deltaproteobacteria bacterium]
MSFEQDEKKGSKSPHSGSNEWRVRDFLHIGLAGFPKQGMISIDVTYRCNLSCVHCYFRKQGYRKELTVDEWLAWLEDRRAKGYPFLICGWLGGEPLLRRELLEKGLPYFKSNVIFTNGTFELGPWSDSTFVVSVPALREQYPSMTGADTKTFDRVMAHADRKDLRVFISFCVTRPTLDLVPRVLDEWGRTAVSGVYFEFYTPNRGDDLRLWVDWETRDRLISRLLKLKKTYGDFIANTRQELLLMKSRSFRSIILDCPFHRIGASFDPMGRPKYPCAVGPEADCSRCGCILPAFAEILSKRRLSIRAIWEGARRDLKRRTLKRTPGHWDSLLPFTS